MTTNNPWHSLSFGFTPGEDSFNDVVSGSTFLGVGKHEDVFIEGIEPGKSVNGTPYLKITWSNDDKQSINQWVYLSARDRETGVEQLHFKFKQLLSALISDKSLRMEFFNKASKMPELYASFVGLRATIEVSQGKSGYTIKPYAAGGFVLYDVESGSQIGTDIYGNYTEANEAAKAQSLKRAFDEVSKVYQSEKSVAKNDDVIRTVGNSAKPAAAFGKPGSSLAAVNVRSTL